MKNKKILYTDNSDYFKYNRFKVFTYITKANSLFDSNDTLTELLSEKNYSINNIAYCEQVHSDRVLYISKPGLYSSSDGLVTKCSNGIILKIQTADCVPVSIYDQKQGLIGLIHSGWKGTKMSICNNAVEIFLKKGSKPENIQVFLGPAIGKCCYEIKNDVSKQFNQKYIFNNHDKIFLDIKLKIKEDLLLAGIKKNNIANSNICTYENNEYYSYRKNKNNERMYSLIGN